MHILSDLDGSTILAGIGIIIAILIFIKGMKTPPRGSGKGNSTGSSSSSSSSSNNPPPPPAPPAG